MLARVVSKWLLLGTTWPGAKRAAEQDALRGAPLVGRDDVAVAEDVLHRLLEAKEARAAGVGLVAAHDAGPLLRAHRRRAAVGQKIDHDVLGAQPEQVEPGRLQQRFALRAGRHADRFDDLDPVWLDDGAVARLGHEGLLDRIYQLDHTLGQARAR